MTALLEELKRRKVVRAALVYAAAAFAVLQAGDLLAAGLRLPEWVFPTITVMVVLGFPLSLVLAWSFDMTATGVQRAESAPAAAAPAWVGRGTLLAAGALLGLGAVLAVGWVAQPDRLPSAGADELSATRAYVVASLVSDRVDIRMATDRFAVAPDGSAVVLVGLDDAGTSGLLLRRRGTLEAVRIPGTSERSRSPVFSPDGRWIAYMEGDALMKVAVGEGQPVRVAQPGGSRLSWGDDDRIRVSSGGTLRGGSSLVAVHASSGTLDSLSFGPDTAIVRGELLPRGRLLLSLVVADTLERIVVREKDGRVRDLAEGFDARYAASGHIIFMRSEGSQRVLLAAALNPRSASLTGELITLQRDATIAGATPAAATANGDLVYLAGTDRADRRIVLLDRRGLEREVAGAEQPWVEAQPSPDGSQLAATAWQGGRRIWTVSAVTGALTPVTRSGDGFGIRWMADGRHLAFTNMAFQSANGGSMLRVPADGSAPPVPIAADLSAAVGHLSFDGRYLLFDRRGRVWVLPLHPDSVARTLLPAPLQERRAMLSPESRWIAFLTEAAGRDELRIGPFRDPAAAVPVARAGAVPVGWSRDGRFFYRTGDEVWELKVGEQGPVTGSASRAFTLPRDVVVTPAIMPDGEHLVVIRGGNLYTDVVMVEGALRRSRRD